MAQYPTFQQVQSIANSITVKADLRFRKLSDAIAETDLATELATKINNKANAADLTALSGKVTTLIGSETGDDAKSVRNISAEEVAKVVAGAPTSFDTLKEIADWIQNDTTGAAKMANDIQSLQTKTELGTHVVEGVPTEYGTVKDYVEGYVAEQIGGAALSAGNGIDITGGVVSAVVTEANGLSLGANGIAMATVTASTSGTGGTNGSMLATDKEKLDGIQFVTDEEVTAYIATLWA